MRFDQRHPGRRKAWHRNHNLVRKYGITAKEWDAMFEQQNRRCAACGTDNPGSKMGWHTDHRGPVPCQKKDIRGILCLSCNHAIGKGERLDADRLRDQLAYVEDAL